MNIRAVFSLFGLALVFSTSIAAQPRAASTASTSSFAIQKIDLSVRDAVYSSLTKQVYASVPSRNAILAVDPTTGTTNATIVVGSNPSRLAVSDDGRFLYVGLNGEHAVRRVDLSTGVPEPAFKLGSDPDFGPYVADDLAVVPGRPDAVVIALANETSSPRHEGVALFVQGQVQPRKTARHTGPTIIEFCDSDNTLYGYNNESSEFGLYQFAILDDGIFSRRLAQSLGVAFDMDFRCVEGLLYPTTGRVTDPQTLNLIGTYPQLARYEAELEVRTDRDLAYIFSVDSDAYTGTGIGTLYEYQQHTFQLRTAYTFQQIQGKPLALFTAGSTTMGLLTRVHGDFEGSLYLLREQGVSATSVATALPHFSPPATNSTTPWTAAQFSLPVRDLIYSPRTKHLYVSVTGVAGSSGNSLIPIAPYNGAIGQSIYVGSEPNRLDQSDDGRYVWVGVDGASSVRRVDLLTHELSVMTPLGRSPTLGWFDTDDLAVVPNKPDLVVVARKNRYTTVPHEGVAVYKPGTILPEYPPVHYGLESQLSTSDVIEFCDTTDLLYGGETLNSSFNFTRFSISNTGITVYDKTRDVFDWYHFDILCQDGLIVATNGQVIDPETQREVTRYPGVIGGIWPNAFAYDPQAQRMYVVSDDVSSTSAARFLVYDAKTYTLLESYMIEGVSGEPRRLVWIDAQHLGLVMRDNTMYLLHRGSPIAYNHKQFIPHVVAPAREQ